MMAGRGVSSSWKRLAGSGLRKQVRHAKFSLEFTARKSIKKLKSMGTRMSTTVRGAITPSEPLLCSSCRAANSEEEKRLSVWWEDDGCLMCQAKQRVPKRRGWRKRLIRPASSSKARSEVKDYEDASSLAFVTGSLGRGGACPQTSDESTAGRTVEIEDSLILVAGEGQVTTPRMSQETLGPVRFTSLADSSANLDLNSQDSDSSENIFSESEEVFYLALEEQVADPEQPNSIAERGKPILNEYYKATTVKNEFPLSSTKSKAPNLLQPSLSSRLSQVDFSKASVFQGPPPKHSRGCYRRTSSNSSSTLAPSVESPQSKRPNTPYEILTSPFPTQLFEAYLRSASSSSTRSTRRRPSSTKAKGTANRLPTILESSEPETMADEPVRERRMVRLGSPRVVSGRGRSQRSAAPSPEPSPKESGLPTPPATPEPPAWTKTLTWAQRAQGIDPTVLRAAIKPAIMKHKPALDEEDYPTSFLKHVDELDLRPFRADKARRPGSPPPDHFTSDAPYSTLPPGQVRFYLGHLPTGTIPSIEVTPPPLTLRHKQPAIHLPPRKIDRNLLSVNAVIYRQTIKKRNVIRREERTAIIDGRMAKMMAGLFAKGVCTKEEEKAAWEEAKQCLMKQKAVEEFLGGWCTNEDGELVRLDEVRENKPRSRF